MVDGPWDTTRCIFVAAFGDIAGRGIAGMPVFHKPGIILNGSAWAKRFSRARTVWADYVASARSGLPIDTRGWLWTSQHRTQGSRCLWYTYYHS
jgi:hypothetical protein